jgi:hypothetical protein
MSYRVTKQTQITNKRLAIEALKLAKMTYEERGNALYITSGPLARATIDLATGNITGDTDYRGHTEEAFGKLRQSYGEAQCRDLSLKQGFTIHDRTTEGENVVLWCCNG